MANFDISLLDHNLAVAAKVDAPDLELHDVRKPPFQIYGLYNPLTEPVFKRMPTEVAATVSEGVHKLSFQTAGGRVRFSTDSPYVVIKAVMPSVGRLSHMPLSGSAGFDLFLDTPDGRESRYHRTFIPPTGMTNGYESKQPLPGKKLHYVTINFPLYNAVDALYIGVAKGSYLGEGAPYRNQKPVVYYGSSITQGGCASRPGNAYQAMISRALSLDFINLGFSGNGRAEDAMLKYLAGLDMSMFVSDYDHNAPNVAHLRATHQKLYDTIREKHPDIPYIMISRPDFFATATAARRRVVQDTYNYALDKGDHNVYYVDGESFFQGPFEDCCTVDHTHPTDLGFAMMANTLICVMRRILHGDISKSYFD
ncbi:MAG: hypothetical protein IJY50_07800 [Clostridia bacterium]|nr:hypothetical protein [Clostridia bacterium]